MELELLRKSFPFIKIEIVQYNISAYHDFIINNKQYNDIYFSKNIKKYWDNTATYTFEEFLEYFIKILINNRIY